MNIDFDTDFKKMLQEFNKDEYYKFICDVIKNVCDDPGLKKASQELEEKGKEFMKSVIIVSSTKTLECIKKIMEDRAGGTTES